MNRIAITASPHQCLNRSALLTFQFSKEIVIKSRTPIMRTVAVTLLGLSAIPAAVAQEKQEHSLYDKEWKTPIDGPAQ